MIAVELRDDESLRRARERLRQAKSAFSRIAALSLQGKATPDQVGRALHTVDTARAALRRAERRR